MPAAVTCQVNRLTTRSAAGAPELRPQGGVVQQPADGPGQRTRIVRRDEQPRLPVVAHDFGQRAASGGHHGDATGHRFDRRQREALVERGHHGNLRFAIETSQRIVADAADAVHGVRQSQAHDGPINPAALIRPPDHGQLNVALGAQLGDGFEERHQTLHRDVATRGHHDAPRLGRHVLERTEHRVVDPDRHHGHALRGHTHLRGDVVPRVLRHRQHGGQCPRHPDLHAEEPEPSASGETLPGVGCMGQGELAVDRDGMVQRRQQGPAVFDHSEHCVAQALIVVHDVEFVTAFSQQLTNSQRIGQRLSESRRAHDGEFSQVLTRVEFAGMGHPERIGVAVEIETGHRGETHTLVQLRPRGAREDLHGMTECDQLTGQVAGIDPLAPAARVPPVGEEGDASPPWSRWCGRDPGGHLDVARALPGFLGFDPLLAGGLRQRMSRLDPAWPHSLPEPPSSSANGALETASLRSHPSPNQPSTVSST